MKQRLPSNWVSLTRRFVATKASLERCELCAAALRPSHRHLIEIATRQFFCACESCGLALDGAGRFRVVAPRTERIETFYLSDAEWEAMQLPIDIVFFFISSLDRRPTAIYPGPSGGTESALGEVAWAVLLRSNPSLADLEPDVEALLVNRRQNARDYYRVSIDRCYALVGVIRANWRGISGGSEAWDAVQSFFESLERAVALDEKVHIHG